ncbi:MAG: ElyC/SanA/YdcF family protein [Patescibacteria group bacterium]
MTLMRGTRLFLISFFSVSIFLVLVSFYVRVKGESFIVDASEAQASVVIVPGAGLKRDETPSDVLRDRLMVALALYDDGRVEKILCSGDDGQVQYDEVNAMRVWLIDRGVDADDIFLDHAGFDTYDTMTRAAEVFGVTNAVIVTQDFHLPRALYIAEAKGIEVQGVSASLEPYVAQDAYRMREIPSRIKAFFEVLFRVQPKYLGDAIDVMGDGRVTWDEGL